MRCQCALNPAWRGFGLSAVDIVIYSMLLEATNLTKSIGAKDLFTDLTFAIDSEEKNCSHRAQWSENKPC